MRNYPTPDSHGKTSRSGPSSSGPTPAPDRHGSVGDRANLSCSTPRTSSMTIAVRGTSVEIVKRVRVK